MATVVGQASAAATSVAIPAHAAGDLIIVSARGTAAAPSVPAASGTVPAWATLQTGLANAVGLTVVSFVATAATTTTGVFTNATNICVLVLRPAAVKKLQTSAARSAVGNGNNTQTIIYPALTLNNGGGASTSLGVRVGTRTVAATTVGTAPTSWTNQSIQPAGASALMSVHTRLALAANPAADTVTTTGTNAAYRAVTVEVEEVDLGSTQALAATIASAAAVSVGMTVLPPPVSFAIALATNQPYAGEHDAGEFLSGVEPILWVDLQIVGYAILDGLIAGQAQVGASLAVERNLSATVARAASVVAQQEITRGLTDFVVGQAAVSAQQGVVRDLSTVFIARAAAVSADISRVALTVDFSTSIVRAAAVATSLEVDAPNYVNLSASVAGQAAVSAQTVKTHGFSCSVAGQAAVTVALQTTAAISFQALVVGKGDLSVGMGRTRPLGAAPVAGFSSVSTTMVPIRMVPLAIRIETLVPLCGEHLCGVFTQGGPFICGGFSGPHSVITIGVVRIVNWAVPVEGKAEIVSLLRPSTPFAAVVDSKANIQVDFVRSGLAFSVEVGGQAQVDPRMTLLINMPSQIAGKAELKVKINLDWLAPTDPENILLPPTTERDWILIPTTPAEGILVPSMGAVEVLTPTDEEDWILIPTTERTM